MTYSVYVSVPPILFAAMCQLVFHYTNVQIVKMNHKHTDIKAVHYV